MHFRRRIRLCFGENDEFCVSAEVPGGQRIIRFISRCSMAACSESVLSIHPTYTGKGPVPRFQ